PVNEADRPIKSEATETILVIEAEEMPTSTEQDALAEYWTARWREPTSASATSSALATLESVVGVARAAELAASFVPFNFGDEPTAPASRENTTVVVAFLELPPPGAASTTGTWTGAPVTRVLPEQLVLRAERAGAPVLEVVGQPIPSPLAVGPDPEATGSEQLTQQNGVLEVPASIRWMVDFDDAVKIGMGFRVPLTPEQAAAGFDRVMVLGVRLTTDAAGGAAALAQLIEHHRFGTEGFALMRQGTPTNNTESADAANNELADSNDSFDAMFGANVLPAARWVEKRDGQWLSELLGLEPGMFDGVEGATGRDQIVARAMNMALWPATLGYTFASLLHPALSDTSVDGLRWFFTRFVSGRGWIPAIRIGNQPYGILPTSAMRRWQWLTASTPLGFRGADGTEMPSAMLPQLLQTLRAMEADWEAMSALVSAVGRSGDPHQMMLDILGLHPTSVEFHQRLAQSLDSVRVRLRLLGVSRTGISVLDDRNWQQEARQLLRSLGYTGAMDPQALAKIFHGAQQLLRGPLIDDRELSELDRIRSYTADNRNYVRWLIDAARTSLETLRAEDGFTGDEAPTALLYLLLRHALLLGYWDTSVRLHVAGGVLDVASAFAMRRESPFVHVASATAPSESRWSMLYREEPRVTGGQPRLVAEHITSILGTLSTRHLDDMLEALERLEATPTAQLERAFVEHLDCAGYRLDAWVLGLIQLQLATMRYAGAGESTGEGAKRGIYLGAFGWLEDVRPRVRQAVGVSLDPAIADFFAPPGAAPLMRDEMNDGYMITPSLNHAVTAAVLRSGHLSNKSSANAAVLAVDLSSARVRIAQQILEGIRHGQSLGALLGYRFERGLHDRHGMAEVDAFIFPLRKQFPLRADRLDATRTAPDVPIEAIEARNVVDGQSLVEHIRRSGVEDYPFGLGLPNASGPQAAGINAEVRALLEAYDAVADLALAESVHQAAQGNFDRAAANLDAYGRGGLPPEPDVVRTPRSGASVTNRVALHLAADATHLTSPITGLSMTPRATCEPRLNAWLASRLPLPDRVYCKVMVTNAVTGTTSELDVTQSQLGLQSLDLLNCVVETQGQGMGELEDRIARRVWSTLNVRPDSRIDIRFTAMSTDRSLVSFFELSPLLRTLRAIVSRSRPLRPTDLGLAGDASDDKDVSLRISIDRVNQARSDLAAARTILLPIATTLANRLSDMVANRATLLAEVDATIVAAANAGITLMNFGVRTPVGEWYAWRSATTARLAKLVDERAAKWETRRAEATARLGLYDLLPAATPDEERYVELESIERLVAAQATIPRPGTPALARTQVGNALVTFQNRLADLRGTIQTPVATLSALRDVVAAELPLTTLDVEPFSLTGIEEEILRFLGDLSAALDATLIEIDRRLAVAQAAVNDATAANEGPARVDILRNGAKAIFGDEFSIVPYFDVPDEMQGSLSTAMAHTASGDLLRFQIEQRGNREPVDTWLYGAARVRDALRSWEQAAVMSEGFGRPTLSFTPLQLALQPVTPWLALEYPAGTTVEGEALCYTAHFAQTFDPSEPQCGLLIDEWPEVIPAAEQTAALTFQYDRPNAEPPQCWLLVTPSRFGQGWSWDDVVDGVRETFERARRRAVEPAHVDATPYARFLPATVMATTLFPIAIATNLARNNGLLHALAESPHA
ncbi:MAG TPA: hypothetical protein VJ672_17525, partial [Gemmatimonadaceae bacterium]|nr:hypothetical protein [Gemmatimonadaceae bacterium]